MKPVTPPGPPFLVCARCAELEAALRLAIEALAAQVRVTEDSFRAPILNEYNLAESPEDLKSTIRAGLNLGIQTENSARALAQCRKAVEP